jgi:hypothetical protein
MYHTSDIDWFVSHDLGFLFACLLLRFEVKLGLEYFLAMVK